MPSSPATLSDREYARWAPMRGQLPGNVVSPKLILSVEGYLPSSAS